MATSSTAEVLTFEFAGGTNLDPEKDLFIHDARLVLRSADEIESAWTAWKGGKEDHRMTFALRRAEG
jgi:hypothetical protein